MTGSDDVVVARIAPGLQISSRFSKRACLTCEVLDDGLDDDVDVGEVVEPRRAGDPGERRVAVGLGGLAALHGLLEALGERGAHGLDLGVGAGDVDDVVAGLGEDLDDAGRHGARADDSDLGDRAQRDAPLAVGPGVWASSTTCELPGAAYV